MTIIEAIVQGHHFSTQIAVAVGMSREEVSYQLMQLRRACKVRHNQQRGWRLKEVQ